MKKIYVKPSIENVRFDLGAVLFELGSGGQPDPNGNPHGGGNNTTLPDDGDEYSKRGNYFSFSDFEDEEVYDY